MFTCSCGAPGLIAAARNDDSSHAPTKKYAKDNSVGLTSLKLSKQVRRSSAVNTTEGGGMIDPAMTEDEEDGSVSSDDSGLERTVTSTVRSARKTPSGGQNSPSRSQGRPGGSDQFQSYVYQLIKARLVGSVKNRLKTALCVDMPRSTELYAVAGKAQFHFHAKPKVGLKAAALASSTVPAAFSAARSGSGGTGADPSKTSSHPSSSVLNPRRPSRR